MVPIQLTHLGVRSPISQVEDTNLYIILRSPKKAKGRNSPSGQITHPLPTNEKPPFCFETCSIDSMLTFFSFHGVLLFPQCPMRFLLLFFSMSLTTSRATLAAMLRVSPLFTMFLLLVFFLKKCSESEKGGSKNIYLSSWERIGKTLNGLLPVL